ncbi:type IV pilus biogenesis protein PilM [Dickeya dadantii]|uniref:type IV pilus biogenesis protein PilM n=1 Tax=Dickeya dadantii TaxID=204038 RepID=UPI001495F7AC|nr:type IV pilus biogenesis protein PilM [Dickeya dadantii]NPE55915.1 type IV pilus biogenesis protein PilM [Dickeya dadantii]NPE67139.1 type IV pilus biogenesis protein PilM [Dickeya dadantii]
MFGISKVLTISTLILSVWMFTKFSFLENALTDSSYTDTSAKSFITYAERSIEWKKNNPNTAGDMTNTILTPSWLSQRSDIRVYSDGMKVYVFMKLSPGVITEINKLTGNSAFIGLSTSVDIKTNYGAVAKPSFIPADYVVYII